MPLTVQPQRPPDLGDVRTLPLPAALGGRGRGLAGCCDALRQLAGSSPPEAWQLLPHLAHVGAAAELSAGGDHALDWLLEIAGRGETIGDHLREPGNDIPILHAAATAEPVDGGYRFSGELRRRDLDQRCPLHAVRGIDLSHRGAPRIVHAIAATDDLLGGASSVRVRYHGAFVPRGRVVREVTPGLAGADPWVVGLFTWSFLGEAAISRGIVARLLELTLGAIRCRSSVALARTGMIHHPGVQGALAELLIDTAGVDPHLDRLLAPGARRAHSPAEWIATVLVARDRAAALARRAGTLVLDLLGEAAPSEHETLQELLLEAAMGRAGRSDGALARELIAKTALGIDPDEQPRWG